MTDRLVIETCGWRFGRKRFFSAILRLRRKIVKVCEEKKDWSFTTYSINCENPYLHKDYADTVLEETKKGQEAYKRNCLGKWVDEPQ